MRIGSLLGALFLYSFSKTAAVRDRNSTLSLSSLFRPLASCPIAAVHCSNFPTIISMLCVVMDDRSYMITRNQRTGLLNKTHQAYTIECSNVFASGNIYSRSVVFLCCLKVLQSPKSVKHLYSRRKIDYRTEKITHSRKTFARSFDVSVS